MPSAAPTSHTAASALCASAAQRLLLVAALLAGLWLAVYWALQA